MFAADAGDAADLFVVPGIEDINPTVAGGGDACEVTGERVHGE